MAVCYLPGAIRRKTRAVLALTIIPFHTTWKRRRGSPLNHSSKSHTNRAPVMSSPSGVWVLICPGPVHQRVLTELPLPATLVDINRVNSCRFFHSFEGLFQTFLMLRWTSKLSTTPVSSFLGITCPVPRRQTFSKDV